ncbi:MAG: hypothetical protein V4662_13660 [Verrucomicrobiota bacterium]
MKLLSLILCLLLTAAFAWAGMLINPYRYVVAGGGGGTSYANAGGTGNRSGIISIATSGSAFVGTVGVMIDGSLASTGFYFGGAGTAGDYISFDFGSDKIIDEVRWTNNAPFEHGVWKLQGSADNSSYSDLGASFTLGSTSTATSTHPVSNTSGFRYYRLTKVSGANSGSPWLYEIEFKIGTP